MTRLADIGEFEAIRRLLAARPQGMGVVIGSGDDAAVLRPEGGRDIVATVDAFAEGHHWREGLIGPKALGSRLAHANLSDLAAMGAAPRWGLISLGVRSDHEIETLMELDAGVAEALGADGAALVGGNLTAVEGAEWMSLTLLGTCAAGAAWTRAGARPGDLVAVTGFPGRAGAGLALATRQGRPASGAWWEPLFAAWVAPRSRIALAQRLAGAGVVRAAVDVSDGMGSDLAHVCEASAVGAELDAAAWPEDPLLERAMAELGLAPDAARFGPSDDYELVLAVAPEHRSACQDLAREMNVPLAFAGRFVPGEAGITWISRDGSRQVVPRRGFDHFSS